MFLIKDSRLIGRLSRLSLSFCTNCFHIWYVNVFVSDGTRVPKIDTLTKVAYALGVDVNELVTDSEHFIIEAKEKYGSRGKVAAEELIKNANALFAGGEISEEDKQNVMEALQEAYWRAKIKNKKYTPKKYLKETEDKNADENKSEKWFWLYRFIIAMQKTI